MPATEAIHTANAERHDEVIHVLVMAFTADPTARWIWPSSQTYLTHFGDFVRAYGGRAFEHDTAHHVQSMCGAALWLPPNVAPDDDAVEAAIRRSVPEPRHEEVFGVFEQLEPYHPKEPHWYLPLIGVDPAHHRKGLGSALMKHALALCDRDGTRAFLESSNPENVSLYERHGFKTMGTVQSGDSPPLIPMIREPA